MNRSKEMFSLIEDKIDRLFGDTNQIMKAIDFMKMNPEIAWFNTAAIFMQRINPIKVMSKIKWDSYFNQEVYIKQDRNPIRIIIPSIIDEVIIYNTTSVFDIEDINTNQEKFVSSHYQELIEQLGGIGEVQTTISVNELQSQIHLFLKEIPFFQELSNVSIMLIKDCCHYACNSFFTTSKLTTDISMLSSVSITEKIYLYATLKEIIDKIPSLLALLFYQKKDDFKSKEKYQELLKLIARNIKTRIVDAQHKKYEASLWDGGINE